MTKEQAVVYLRFSGFSDEQIKAIEGAFSGWGKVCPSAGVDCEDCPAYEKKSECEHDHEILKAYSDGASAVLESLIEQYEHYLELLDADIKDGSATIVTKTKYAVYTEVVKQLKEVLESEDKA